MSKNKITFGLRACHYSLATQDNSGNWTFGTPKALPGAQEFSSEAVGGATNVYADDSLYATLVQNAGRTLTVKFTEISEDFKKEVLGYKELEDGNLVEIANAPIVTFAFGFQIDGDSAKRKVWYYLCNVTPLSEATKSKADSVEANSVTLNITARPIEVNDYLITCRKCEQDQSNYDTYLDVAPVVPTAQQLGGN